VGPNSKGNYSNIILAPKMAWMGIGLEGGWHLGARIEFGWGGPFY